MHYMREAEYYKWKESPNRHRGENMAGTLVSRDEFKGNALIRLHRNEKDDKPWGFGLGKAKLAKAHFSEIMEFAENEIIPEDEKLVLEPDSKFPWHISRDQAALIVRDISEIENFVREELAKQ